MEWITITEKEYKDNFKNSFSIFQTSDFNSINSDKAKEIKYLLFKGKQSIFGFICGEKEGIWYSPFSSPFGGIELIGDASENEITKALTLLCKGINKPLQITLAPSVYNQTPNPNQYLKAGFSKCFIDYNFHLDLSKDSFQESLLRNAKKHLKNALNLNHTFRHANNDDLIQKAYSIIAQNRKERGYELKMSLEQILFTRKVVDLDFYILEINNIACASALVYKVNHETAMVVYWGHLSEHSEFRPINLIAYYLFNHYKKEGYKILDIGPSSEKGILNEGLANFKLSLGCVKSEKITVRYDSN